jgi:DNA-binding IclR family transcriptional regulator
MSPPLGVLERPGASSQALDRLAGLLFALSDADAPPGAAELARRAGVPVSSTYRLLSALSDHGLVERDAHGGVRLGLRVLELAQAVQRRLQEDLITPARPVMSALVAEHRETALLTAPVGDRAIGLSSIDSPEPIRLSYARWTLAPLHRGASGKVLLAHMDSALADRVIAGAGPGLDEIALRDDLALARRDGTCITVEELDTGATGVAAPIFDARGRLVAGLTLAGPTDRVRGALPALVEGVRTGAREIGGALAGPR